MPMINFESLAKSDGFTENNPYTWKRIIAQEKKALSECLGDAERFPHKKRLAWAEKKLEELEKRNAEV